MADYNESHINELAAWIDPFTIARTILESLEETGTQPTVENAKLAWLDLLENNLSSAICEAVKFAPVFASERPGLRPVRIEFRPGEPLKLKAPG